ncbi:helix-hairpin-helix domain-containing protein [candidate division KSB1 bacterium]|nr:helix-hairpin-helix domain-containing protein [candidate division KSB1 bacterium]
MDARKLLTRVWISAVLFGSVPVLCQEQEWNEDLQQLTEIEEGIDWGEYSETLAETPLDLNRATLIQLQHLLHDSLLATRIQEWVETNGPFSDLQELVETHLLSAEQFKQLKPFVRFAPPVVLRLRGRHRISMRSPQSRAFLEGHYAGNPVTLLNRLSIDRWPHWRLSLLTDKDAGELSWMDFVCGNLQLHSQRLGCTLTVGHFLVETGQGLLSWGPYRMPTGSSLLDGFATTGRGIVPFTGTAENASFCGAALSIERSRWQSLLFFSNRLLDATLDGDTIRTLVQSGLHRNANELEKKDTAGHQAIGIQQNLNLGSWNFALSALGAHFSPPLYIKSAFHADENRSANRFHLLSAFLNRQLLTAHVFAEIAVQKGQQPAWVGGIRWRTDAGKLTWLIRSYPADFYNPFGRSFFARNALNNEQGVYLGWQTRLFRGTRLGFYGDCYTIPWPGTLLDMPFSGTKMGSHLSFTPLRGIQIECRLDRHSDWERLKTADSWGNTLIQSMPRLQQRLQLSLKYKVGSELHTRFRFEKRKLETRDTTNPVQSGVLFAQDIDWRWNIGRVTFCWLFFDTPGSAIKFYRIQSGVPGTLQFIPLSGRGQVQSAAVRTKRIWGVQGTAQIVLLAYDDRVSVGNGADEIRGNRRWTFTLQIDWQVETPARPNIRY